VGESQNCSLLLTGEEQGSRRSTQYLLKAGHEAGAEQTLHMMAVIEEQIIAQQWFSTSWQENKGTRSHLLYLRNSAERSDTCLSVSKHIGLALQGIR